MSREKTADPFLEKAKSLTKLPHATSHCWTMVKRGIGAGMLPESELVGLIKDLEQQKDCIAADGHFALPTDLLSKSPKGQRVCVSHGGEAVRRENE